MVRSLAAFALVSFVVLAEDAPKPKLDREVASLIRQLASEDFDQRLEAADALKACGESARAPLEKALKSSDPEVAHAARVLLKVINRSVVEVSVKDPDGKPCADVAVMLYLHQQTSNGRMMARNQLNVKTNADGVAIFSDLEPERYSVNLNASVPGFLPAHLSKQNQQLKVGVNRFELACKRGGTIQGVLLDAEKKPLRGARVVAGLSHYLKYQKQKGNILWQVMSRQPAVETDETGAFKITALRDSEYVICVLGKDKILFTGEKRTIKDDNTVDLAAIETGLDAKELGDDEAAEGEAQAAEDEPAAEEPAAAEAKLEPAKKE